MRERERERVSNETERRTEGLSVVNYATPLGLICSPDFSQEDSMQSTASLHDNQASGTRRCESYWHHYCQVRLFSLLVKQLKGNLFILCWNYVCIFQNTDQHNFLLYNK